MSQPPPIPFPLPHDLLQNYFIPNFLINSAQNVTLDDAPYPVVLCAFRSVCKRFLEVALGCKIAVEILSNFRNFSSHHKKVSGQSQFFRVIQDYGNSPTFIQWVLEQLYFELHPDSFLPAAERKFLIILIFSISCVHLWFHRRSYWAVRMAPEKDGTICMAHSQQPSFQLHLSPEMGTKEQLLQWLLERGYYLCITICCFHWKSLLDRVSLPIPRLSSSSSRRLRSQHHHPNYHRKLTVPFR